MSEDVPERSPPSRPRIPYVYGLEVGSRRRTWLMGIRVPFAVSRLCRERRATLGWVGNVVVAVAFPFCCFAALPRKAQHFGMGGYVIVALLCPGRISRAFPPP